MHIVYSSDFTTDKKKTKTPLHSNQIPSLPLIAIMAATTTRKVSKPSTKNLSLFMYLLPSMIRTLDCGFRYEYVLGYDKGDPFYDSAEVRYVYFLWYLFDGMLYHCDVFIMTSSKSASLC